MVVVGVALPQVVFRSVYTEVNAKLQAQAMALGGQITYLDTGRGAAGRGVDRRHARPPLGALAKEGALALTRRSQAGAPARVDDGRDRGYGERAAGG